MSKISLLVTSIACLVAVSFLLCGMVLLSSIIVWLSVEFSGPIPHALGFILGLLSLLNCVLAILMIGLAKVRKAFAVVFVIANVLSLLASVALFIPWVILYSEFCEGCTEPEISPSCIQECSDEPECCFRDTSRPLAVIFVVFSALCLLLSVVGVCVAVPYLRYRCDAESTKRR